MLELGRELLTTDGLSLQPMKKTVALHTLGCKLNFSETSSLSRILEKEGFEKRSFEEAADVYVINTCSVTDNADKECRLLVRRIQKRAPGSTVVITGCYAQLKPEEIASIEGVDLVLGAAEKFNIVHHLKEFTKGDPSKICSCDIEDVHAFNASHSQHDRTRTFLKVQDGCDYSCAFCTIPMARGKSRSDNIENILEKVKELAAAGVKEVVLTGINLGDFGMQPQDSTGDHRQGLRRSENFLMLMQALEEEEAVPRYRISSIEPNLLSAEIIELVAQSKKFMPHFHIPLQSGSNRILRLMKRRYKKELYAEKVELIKNRIPHASIGADVIVGFPGETEDDFKETFDFLHRLPVSYLHVFTYSERAGTSALEITPVIPKHIRFERNSVLRNLSYKKSTLFSETHRGQLRPVLFEHQNAMGMMEGYSDNYIKISTPFNEKLVNNIVDWSL